MPVISRRHAAVNHPLKRPASSSFSTASSGSDAHCGLGLGRRVDLSASGRGNRRPPQQKLGRLLPRSDRSPPKRGGKMKSDRHPNVSLLMDGHRLALHSSSRPVSATRPGWSPGETNRRNGRAAPERLALGSDHLVDARLRHAARLHAGSSAPGADAPNLPSEDLVIHLAGSAFPSKSVTGCHADARPPLTLPLPSLLLMTP